MLVRCRLVAAAIGTLVSSTGAASQAITTLGSSAAQTCYEAARDHRTANVSTCDQALSGALSLPDRVATHVNRGILRARKGDYSKALLDYDSAISLHPDEAEAFLNKGLLLLRLHRDREALEFVSLAIAKKTGRPALAYFARATAHEELGHAGAAYRDYQQAAKLDSKWDLPVRELRRFRKKT